MTYVVKVFQRCPCICSDRNSLTFQEILQFFFSFPKSLKQTLAIVIQEGMVVNLGCITQQKYQKPWASTNLKGNSSLTIMWAKAFLHASALKLVATRLPSPPSKSFLGWYDKVFLPLTYLLIRIFITNIKHGSSPISNRMTSIVHGTIITLSPRLTWIKTF